MIGADTTKVGAEIERKFLLRDTGVVARLAGTLLVQGYFGTIDGWSVRLRMASGQQAGDRDGAWLTLKSTRPGSVRQEIESPVPPDFARGLLDALPSERRISKIRYHVPGKHGLTWEIDRFLAQHDGLWLAEIELPSRDLPLELPDWLGPEVTDNPHFRNAALAQSPQGDAAPPELADLVRRLLRETGRYDAGRAAQDNHAAII